MAHFASREAISRMRMPPISVSGAKYWVMKRISSGLPSDPRVTVAGIFKRGANQVDDRFVVALF
jgi:hypothetical protein